MSEATGKRRAMAAGSASVADKRFRRGDGRAGKGRRLSQRVIRWVGMGAVLGGLVAIGAV